MEAKYSDSTFIRIIVKNLEQNEEFVVDPRQNVRAFRPLVAERFNARLSHLTLIHAGRMMNDEDTLIEHEVQQGHVIHLVIHNGKRIIHRRPQSCVQEHMEWNAEENTEMDNNDLELDAQRSSYIVGSLLNNQDFISELLRSDPRVENYFNANRELANIIHNSPMVRDYLSSISNTHTMQEIIRNQEMVLRNIEAIPGGLEALESICISNSHVSPVNTTNAPQENPTDDNGNTTSSPEAQPTSAAEDLNPFLPSPEVLTRLLNNSHVQQLLQNITNDPTFLQNLHVNMSNLGNLGSPQQDEAVPANSLPVSATDTPPAMGTSPGLQDFMNQLANQRPPPQIQPPAVRYSNQLEQLRNMGFTDHKANLLALCRTFGNVKGAVKILTKNE